MAILSFAMQKGSVGKTTTTLAVGVELAQLGARVLLVDIDPQSNLTQALGYDPTQLQQSIHNVLLNPTHSLDAATLHTEHGVDLVPATLVLAGAELTLASVFGRELRLRTALIDQQITAANQADKTMVCEVVLAIAAKRPGQQQHFCADRGYDYTDVHTFVLGAGDTPHSKHRRRRGEAAAPAGDVPGEASFPARRWVVERTFNWLLSRNCNPKPIISSLDRICGSNRPVRRLQPCSRPSRLIHDIFG